jgi:hypothetical protein
MAKKGQYVFGARLKAKFIEVYEKTGSVSASAAACGISPFTVADHRYEAGPRFDPEFGQKCAEAYDRWRYTLEKAAYERAIEGMEEHRMDRDGNVIYTKRVFSDNLHLALLKRHIPEFRDRQQVDVNLTAGIVVVPGVEEDADAWRDTHCGGVPAKKGK